MPTHRQAQTPEERSHKLLRQAQLKRDEAKANEAAVDRMIRRNIEEFGP